MGNPHQHPQGQPPRRAHLGIGTGWVRAGFVIACFFGGIGLLFYAVGWLMIPEEGEEESIAATKVSDLEGSSRWIGVALIVVGVLLVLGWTDAIRGELVWAGALILAGVLLYRGEIPVLRRHTSPPASPPPPPPAPPAPPVLPDDRVAAGVALGVETSDDTEPDIVLPAEASVPPPPPVSPRPKSPRSMLGRITLASLLIVLGAFALFDNAGVIEPAARHYVGAAVGVVGLGLMAGAFFGRARWPHRLRRPFASCFVRSVRGAGPIFRRNGRADLPATDRHRSTRCLSSRSRRNEHRPPVYWLREWHR